MRPKRNVEPLYEICHPTTKRLQCTAHLNRYKHCTFPGFNLHSSSVNKVETLEDAASFYRKPDLIFNIPLPFFPPDRLLSNSDDVLTLVREKFYWKRRKNKFKNLCRDSVNVNENMASAVQRIKERKTAKIVPYGIAQLSDHLSRDPDIHFKGMYNWYYGNTLDILELGNVPYLLSSKGFQPSQLHITSFKLKRNDTNVNIPFFNSELAVKPADMGEIFEIVSANDIVGVRQKTSCSFFKLAVDNNNEIDISKSWSISSEVPYVTMAVKSESFCTVNADRIIKIWAPEYSRKPVCMGKLPTNEYWQGDKYVTIKYPKSDENSTLLAMDRSNIYCFDERLSLDNPVSKWNAFDNTESCEEGSLLIPSTWENYCYVGFTHSCFMLDIRGGFTQKWTHMLRQTPSLGSSVRVSKIAGGKEMLLLATQSSNDVIAVRNDWSAEGPMSRVLPTHVPSTADALPIARYHGACLDPSLNCRFQNSTIGLRAYKRKKNLCIFIQKSTGDVFYQNVKSQENIPEEYEHVIEDTDLEYLEKWENLCYEIQKSADNSICGTRMVEMSEILQASNVDTVQIPEWKKPDISKAKWKISKKELQSYADLLANQILDDFEIDEIPEWEGDDQTIVESRGKVESWLERNSGGSKNALSQMNTSDIEELINPGSDHSSENEEDENGSRDISVSVTDDEDL